ncbi:MAG: hypothetical protein IJO46_08065 [Thermoguttaceae bacterium]|nr:hypothetical protein [Thermoguttaceae bacterium]
MSHPPLKKIAMDDFDVFFDEPDDAEVDGSAFLDNLFGDASDETTETPSPRLIRREAKRAFLRIRQQEALRELVREPPAPGESRHVVSANKFNFWTWVPTLIDWIGATDSFYCATWTANRQSVKEFFELCDAGKVRGRSGFLLGTYFKRREPVVYTLLAEGLAKRGGKIKAFETHCKVILLDAPERNAYLTIEGSANLTANPRLEQYVVSNDRDLWEFHRAWFEEMFALKGKFAWP